MPKSLKESLGHSKAEYRQLGKSGLRVSVPILGAMSFGSKQWNQWVIEEDEVSFSLSCKPSCSDILIHHLDRLSNSSREPGIEA